MNDLCVNKFATRSYLHSYGCDIFVGCIFIAYGLPMQYIFLCINPLILKFPSITQGMYSIIRVMSYNHTKYNNMMRPYDPIMFLNSLTKLCHICPGHNYALRVCEYQYNSFKCMQLPIFINVFRHCPHGRLADIMHYFTYMWSYCNITSSGCHQGFPYHLFLDLYRIKYHLFLDLYRIKSLPSRYTYKYGNQKSHFVLCLFWISINLKYPFQLCYCSQSVIGDTLNTITSCDIFWDKHTHPQMHAHPIKYFSKLPFYTVRHYAITHKYQLFKIFLHMANQFIYNFIHFYIATMWQQIYLLFTLAYVEQFDIAYFLNALYSTISIFYYLHTSLLCKSFC